MRVLLLITAVLAALAAPGPGARAATEGLDLSVITCATIQREGKAPNPRMLAAAYAGRIAAKAGNARFASDFITTLADAMHRDCGGTDAAAHKLADIVAGVTVPAASDKDRDFATLTCVQLAPIWKDEARLIVPFLVALRDTAANTPINKATLDKVGEGLPRLCRDSTNASKLVIELVQDLK